MARDKKIELLKKISLFTPCTDKELRRIGALVDAVEVEPGKVLTKEGDAGHEFFVVADGKADVVIGKKQIAEVNSGDFFGEMSLLDLGPRAATITAKTPMTLYVLDGRSFARFVEEVPTVGRKIMKVLAERLRECEKQAYTH